MTESDVTIDALGEQLIALKELRLFSFNNGQVLAQTTSKLLEGSESSQPAGGAMQYWTTFDQFGAQGFQRVVSISYIPSHVVHRTSPRHGPQDTPQASYLWVDVTDVANRSFGPLHLEFDQNDPFVRLLGELLVASNAPAGGTESVRERVKELGIFSPSPASRHGGAH